MIRNEKRLRVFLVKSGNKVMIGNAFIVTDGQNQVELQTLEDIPKLLERCWLDEMFVVQDERKSLLKKQLISVNLERGVEANLI
ncbi:hypothetical protein KI096_002786 [Enterococcus faecalis]|uniref:hypothetical protein n=1 Tax=Enterococcus faecalis TaxID=1351 RepID=UPI0027FEB8F1|nr:hypothetical protein [Enterococcus faecalis]EKZ0111264.1 hypothetical protein [Enterococcus faecalis]